MLSRDDHLTEVRALLDHFPVVAVLGARQVGKTTLAREIARSAAGPVAQFDLEDPSDAERLGEAKYTLEPLRGLVILDEVQRVPELFPLLRVLADRENLPARFLILGSASPALLRQSSESLAGRIAFHHLGPLGIGEVGAEAWKTLWSRGGFPRSFLAADDAVSFRWRQEFARTYLERDLSELGIRVPSGTIRRFWSMLAHYHGQIWNAAELGRAFGVSERTINRYLDILLGTFMVQRLTPWFENIGKREMRTPKVYLTDSGLLHLLLGLRELDELEGHPKVGASFEGFAMQQVVGALGAAPEECFFWGVHTGAELDLLIVRGAKRWGFEFKRTSAPRTTRSMRTALETLGLERVDVVYPGREIYPLAPGIRAVGVEALGDAFEGG